jgi:beta-phosphoglucomutase-like phosphatase (HAD superfamily)
LAVASSSSRAWVEPHLERFGLRGRFSVVRTRDDVARTKPAPDLFLAACEGLGVEPAEAVALEDSAHGVTAARAAGLRCVVVPNQLTRLTDLSHADLRIDSLADLRLDARLTQHAIRSSPLGTTIETTIETTIGTMIGGTVGSAQAAPGSAPERGATIAP